MRVGLGPLTIALIALLAFGSVVNASGNDNVVPIVGVETLSRAIDQDLPRVPEFLFIRKRAKELGLKVYLFGGTAAGFAHYAKWALLSQKGDTRFQPNRFDFDITNIYRSNQDLDLLVDGPMDDLEKLETEISAKFPFFAGDKAQWELRPLREARGEKIALLNNADFFDQHNDSNSTGLIELTDTPGVPRVRDLRNFDAADASSIFLQDVASGQIKYYFSDNHESTSYFREGRNPAILSVIRFLIKAFQYQLAVHPEDREKLRQLINDFDPKRITNPYVLRWIEKNGKKLFQNAVDIEYAYNTLEELGLRRKLIAIQNNARTEDSLAWWLSKAPLTTLTVGRGNKATAAERGLTIVAHETKSFSAFESITRSHTGAPNVFISRQGAAGEAAIYGDGFYTAVGRKGARETGLTIRFDVDPRAREGTDFFRRGPYVIFLNKAALHVIPESLNMGWPEYFEFLLAQRSFDENDKGMVEKFNRRLAVRASSISDSDLESIVQILVSRSATLGFVEEKFMVQPFHAQRPDLLVQLYSHNQLTLETLVAALREAPLATLFAKKPDLQILTLAQIEKLPAREKKDSALRETLNELVSYESVETTISAALTLNDVRIEKIVAENFAFQKSAWIETLVRSGHVDLQLVRYVLGRADVKAMPEWNEWVRTIKNRADGPTRDLLTHFLNATERKGPLQCFDVLRAG